MTDLERRRIEEAILEDIKMDSVDVVKGNRIMLTEMNPDSLEKMIKGVVLDAISERFEVKQEPRYRTRQEVCELLHITLPTLNKYTKRGILSGRHFGKRVLYSEEDVLAAVKEIPSLKYKRHGR